MLLHLLQRTAGSATTARRPSTLSKAHVPRPQMRPLPQCPSLSPPRFDDEPAEMPDGEGAVQGTA